MIYLQKERDFWLYIFETIKTNYKLHYHENLCITSVQRGTIVYKIGKNEVILQPESICIINPFQVHKIKQYDKVEKYHILHINSKQSLNADIIKDKSLFEMMNKKEIGKLLHRLSVHFKDTDTEDINSLEKVREFIDKNLDKNITLDELSALAGLNKSYLSRLFKEKYGLSPLRYQLNKRVSMSKTLLDHGKDISQIALELGFYDQAHFYRAFKTIYMITPKEYQKVKNIQ